MIRAMISESIRAIIAQTLCKTKDGSGRVAAARDHGRHPRDPATSSARQDRADVLGDPDGQTYGMQTLDQNCRPGEAQRHFLGRGGARATTRTISGLTQVTWTLRGS